MNYHILVTTFSLFCALLLSSCYDDSETVTINPDGSGTIVQELIMTKQVWQEIKTEIADADTLKGYEDECREFASEFGQGVEFSSFQVVDREGGKGGFVATYHFLDINQVQLLDRELSLEQLFGLGFGMEDDEPEQKQAEVEFVLKGDKLTVNLLSLQNKEVSHDQDEIDAQVNANLQQALTDMSHSRKIVIASGIAQSTASHVQGKEITLLNLPYNELLDQKNWEDLVHLEGGRTVKEAKTLDAIEGVEVEAQTSFTVKMAK